VPKAKLSTLVFSNVCAIAEIRLAAAPSSSRTPFLAQSDVQEADPNKGSGLDHQGKGGVYFSPHNNHPKLASNHLTQGKSDA